LAPYNHVTLKIGTNFVDHLGFENLADHQILKDPWYNVMGIVDTESVYTCVYYDRLSMATEFLDKKFHENFKRWFLQVYDKSQHRLSLMTDLEKFRNYHPLKDGHLAWSDYICDQI